MKLTREQIDIIRNLIKSKISIQTLRDDLFDHLWCEVERKMADNKTFSAAFDEALKEVAPHGLDAIQRQTLDLLDSSKIIFMKKITYSIGLLSAVALSLGWMFSLLRWPGGYELFNSGFLGFLILFIPMIAIDHYKLQVRKTVFNKFKIIIGTLSSLIVGTSLVFKLLHLQGADIILVIGVLGFAFGFLPFLFFTMYKKATRPTAHAE